MKKITALSLAVIAVTGGAGTARAQICAGFPTVDRQFTLGGSTHFPEGLNQWGVEGSYNFTGPATVFADVEFVSLEDGDASEEIFQIGAAFELPSVGTALGSGASACPVLAVSYAPVEDVGTLWGVSAGFGLGGSWSGGPNFTISPYVIPQVSFSRFDAEGDDPDDDDESTDFAVTGGVLLGFGNFWIGPTVGHVFVEGADPVFGIRAGIRL